VRANWNRNADRWTATCDDDGDSNRRYQSDPPMLALPGDLRGLDVLDPGCRDRCLCRKLARAGARITGVDLSERFLRRATRREGEERLGIRYVAGSATRMHSLASESFDRAVSNHVLMDIIDYAAVLREGFRVLGPGGSDRFLRRATRREGEERLGIRYVAGSATRMHSLASESFDRAVSNYVLMDIIDYAAVLREGFRVLGPGGSFVAGVSHPCFASGDGWVT